MNSPAAQIEVSARSETGYVRSENQDRMSGTEVPLGRLYIVADGMGGHKGGATAAELTVQELQQHLAPVGPTPSVADAIRTVHDGDRYIDPALAADAIAAGDSPLSARETDILALATDDAPVTEIARRACLAPGTVRNYLSSALTKLGAGNRHEAVHIARSHGWV